MEIVWYVVVDLYVKGNNILFSFFSPRRVLTPFALSLYDRCIMLLSFLSLLDVYKKVLG